MAKWSLVGSKFNATACGDTLGGSVKSLKFHCTDKAYFIKCLKLRT